MAENKKPDKHLAPEAKSTLDQMSVSERMSQLVLLDSVFKAAEAEKKYLVSLLIPNFQEQGWETVVWQGKNLVRYTSSRPSISKERLLEQGVDPGAIAAATKVTTFETISVRG